MDIQTLSQQLSTFLTPFLPYLLKAGEKAAEEAGKRLGAEAWEQAQALWGKLKILQRDIYVAFRLRNACPLGQSPLGAKPAAGQGIPRYDMYIMNASGTDNHNITPEYFPAEFLVHNAAFSKDDSKIYFIGEWWQ